MRGYSSPPLKGSFRCLRPLARRREVHLHRRRGRRSARLHQDRPELQPLLPSFLPSDRYRIGNGKPQGPRRGGPVPRVGSLGYYDCPAPGAEDRTQSGGAGRGRGNYCKADAMTRKSALSTPSPSKRPRRQPAATFSSPQNPTPACWSCLRCTLSPHIPRVRAALWARSCTGCRPVGAEGSGPDPVLRLSRSSPEWW